MEKEFTHCFFSGLSGIQLPIPKYRYPPPFENTSRLTYYSTFFNSIEINSSFYKVPRPATVTKWAASVPEHFKFTFKLWKEITHAQEFNFKEEDIFKDKNSMYWIRNWYEAIDAEKVKNKLIIHGHTTRRYDTLEEEIKEKKFNAISIDCGCVYNMNVNIGQLCAINIDTLEVIFQKNVDKFEQVENTEVI